MDGLTLNASLCAAEMCDLAEHRSIHLQGETRLCEKSALCQPRNGKDEWIGGAGHPDLMCPRVVEVAACGQARNRRGDRGRLAILPMEGVSHHKAITWAP